MLFYFMLVVGLKVILNVILLTHEKRYLET